MDHAEPSRSRVADQPIARRPGRDVGHARHSIGAAGADRSRAGDRPVVAGWEGPRVPAIGDNASDPSEREVVQGDLAVVRDREDGANVVGDPREPRTAATHLDRRLTQDAIHVRG